MIKEKIKQYKTQNFSLTLNVIDSCQGCFWLDELYTPSDEHIAGETIKVPDHLQERHAPNYYIGQYKPSELASDYAKQGRENPSAEAYKSLQDELAHYIQATDCAIECVIECNGIELSSAYSCGFDWSYDYCGDLEEYAKTMLKEYPDFISEAITEARQELNKFKSISLKEA